VVLTRLWKCWTGVADETTPLSAGVPEVEGQLNVAPTWGDSANMNVPVGFSVHSARGTFVVGDVRQANTPAPHCVVAGSQKLM
jgi:hypothetical protein